MWFTKMLTMISFQRLTTIIETSLATRVCNENQWQNQTNKEKHFLTQPRPVFGRETINKNIGNIDIRDFTTQLKQNLIKKIM